MAAHKLEQQLIELVQNKKRTGLKLLDNLIEDSLNNKRMATPAELAELKQIILNRQINHNILIFQKTNNNKN